MTYDDDDEITVSPTSQEFEDYHDTTMTVEVVVTRTSDEETNSAATFEIHFFSTALDKCYNSEITIES